MKETVISISEFKAKCLRLIDEVASGTRCLIITKRGRPVAKLSPVQLPGKPFMGSWKGIVKVKGDIVHFDTSDEWEALR